MKPNTLKAVQLTFTRQEQQNLLNHCALLCIYKINILSMDLNFLKSCKASYHSKGIYNTFCSYPYWTDDTWHTNHAHVDIQVWCMTSCSTHITTCVVLYVYNISLYITLCIYYTCITTVFLQCNTHVGYMYILYMLF